MCSVLVFCLFGLVIGARSVKSCEEGESNHVVASTAFERVGQILNVYDKKLISAPTWKDFHRSINNLEKEIFKFPPGNQGLVRRVINELRDSEKKHERAIASIGNWCEESNPKLRTYIGIFDGNYNREDAESQRTILKDILKRGVEKMNLALSQLSSCIRHLDRASGGVIQLDNQLESQRKSEISQLDEMSAVPIFAYGLNEMMQNLIDEVNSSYNVLKRYVKNTEEEITSARDELRREIIAVNNLQCQANVTRKFAELSYSIKVLIKLHANNLIEKCRSFVVDWRIRYMKQLF